MTTALVVIANRGELYLPSCLRSATEHLKGQFAQKILVDSSGTRASEPFYAGFDTVVTPIHPLGLSGAVNAAWGALDSSTEHVFHLEEDFTFNRDVHLDHMRDRLSRYADLAQLVLKRQPWSPEEHTAGGIIEMDPAAYEERCGVTVHEKLFSLNPCIYPLRVTAGGWPDDNEAGMAARLLRLGYRFAFYGQRDDPPAVMHIGVERSPAWRL